MRQTVLVTGATGFLGKYLIEELSSNYDIIAIGRNEKIGQTLNSEHCKFYKVDFSNINSLEEKLYGIDIDFVIHAGALSSAWGAWNDFYKCNVIGTENVAQYALSKNVKRMVFVSSPSVYTAKKDLFDIKENEYNKDNKLNYYIKSKIMAEDIMKEYQEKGLYSVIIRPRGLIGIGDPSLMPRLMRANKKIGIPIINKGKNFVDITCVENVALACRLAIEQPDINGETFNITNGEPSEFKSLLEKFCIAADENPKFLNVPFGLLYFLASIAEGFCKLFRIKKEPVLTRYTICTLGFSQTLNIDNAKNKLKYVPKISLAEGIEKYGKWWKENSRS